MTQVNPLQQLPKGQAPSSSIINGDFETLRLANNDIVSRLLNAIDRLTIPEKYSVIVSQIAEIASLNLFGVVGETTYDNNKLSADRYNANLNAFKAAILLRGLTVKNHEISLGDLDEDDSLLKGMETIIENMPDAPSNLEITGVFIVDQNYLDLNPESEYLIGDRIVGLAWTDNSDDETGFEIYQSTVTYNGLSVTADCRPDFGGILKSNPSADATFAEINIGQDFLYPLPENTETWTTEIPFDSNHLRGDDVNFVIRAINLTDYSWLSNTATTILDGDYYKVSRPYNIEIAIVDDSPIINFNQQEDHKIGYEVYMSFGYTSADTEIYPYTLVYTDSIPQAGDSGELALYDIYASDTEFEFDENGNCLNEYMFFKVIAYNEIRRSLVSVEDLTDGGSVIIPPKRPNNLIINTPYQLGGGGDYIIPMAWDADYGGKDSNIIIEGYIDSQWVQISDSGTGFEYGWLNNGVGIQNGFNHNIGTNLSDCPSRYRIKAYNNSGESAYRTITPSSYFKILKKYDWDGNLILSTIGESYQMVCTDGNHIYTTSGTIINIYNMNWGLIDSVDTGHTNVYICTNGTNIFTTSENYIYKYDMSINQVDSVDTGHTNTAICATPSNVFTTRNSKTIYKYDTSLSPVTSLTNSYYSFRIATDGTYIYVSYQVTLYQYDTNLSYIGSTVPRVGYDINALFYYGLNIFVYATISTLLYNGLSEIKDFGINFNTATDENLFV